MTEPATYTRTDMAAALEAARAEGWDRCYSERPLPRHAGDIGPIRQNPYRKTPDTGHGDWTLPGSPTAGCVGAGAS